MVQFRVIDNRRKVSAEIKELEQKLQNYRDYFLQEMSNQIVIRSPVDTGAYMDSMSVGSPPPVRSFSSKDRQGGQPWDTFAQRALENLYQDIAALGKADKLNEVSFANNAPHAGVVEYILGDAPFGDARAESRAIAAEAARKAGLA